MPLSVRLLGLPRVVTDAGELELSRGKTSALLLYLAYGGEWVSRDELLYLFWPDTLEVRARRNLRQLLSTARRLPYAAALEVERVGVRWAVPTDVHPFKRAVHEGRWSDAVQLYGGALLEGDSLEVAPEFGSWVGLERQELARLWHEAALTCAREHEAAGRLAQAAEVLARLHQGDPFDEVVLQSYLRTLYLSRQRDRALETFELFDRTIRHELGREPGAATLRLAETIRREGLLDTPAATATAIAPESATPSTLPLQPTPFVGRRLEKAKLGALVDDPDCRCLTLLGPGGVGKTRLALEVIGAQLGAFEHGVRFVPMASVSSPDLLVSAIADALPLSFHGATDPKAQLLDYLRDKEMLLLLDNLEHLLTGVDVLTEILGVAPKVKVLATSRERLHLHAEWLFDLGGLTFPQQISGAEVRSCDAVALFVARAHRANVSFKPHGEDLDLEDLGLIAQICNLVEGLPLALELAAAWLRVLPLAEVADEVGRGLDLLVAAEPDAPERHGSIRAVFASSWRLLPEGERKVLEALSVFRGGFTRGAAAAVAGATLSALLALTNRSLLRSHTGRFDLHELIRQYAAERLAEDLGREYEAHSKHGAHYLELAERAEPELRGPEQAAWLERLETEHGNLRAALRWAERGVDTEKALRLAGALGLFWRLRGYVREGRGWFVKVLDHVKEGEQTSAHAKALQGAGSLARAQGDYTLSRSLYERGLAIMRALGHRESVADALGNLGAVVANQGDYPLAGALLGESLTEFRQVNDDYGCAVTLSNLGALAYEERDYPKAQHFQKESLTLARHLGIERLIARSLVNLGNIAWNGCDYASARTLIEEGLALFKVSGDKQGIVFAIDSLGRVAHDQRDYALSYSLFRESLTLCAELGDQEAIADALLILAGAIGGLGTPKRAAKLWGAAEVVREAIGAPLSPYEYAHYERDLATARLQLEPATFATAWAEGRKMTLEQAVAYALEGPHP